MWMSNVLILVNRNNLDRNGLMDIAAAVADVGAQVLEVDDQRFAIEANIPTRELPTLSAMEGVAYVRSVFNYCHADPATCPASDEEAAVA